MKQIWKDLGIAFTMGLIVPAVLLGAVVSLKSLGKENRMIADPDSATEPEEHLATVSSQIDIAVLREDGEIVQLPLNDYLTCVVLAEMPVTFEEEALKAQSVVARTYTLRAMEKASKHEAAAVCMDASCCQAYISTDEYLQKGGKEENIRSIERIVTATDGRVLVYEGNLIEATYFSCSGGTTEDAVAVWGTDVPYLQSVTSPGEEGAAYYTDTVSFTAQELASRLDLDLSGDPADWFSEAVYTDGGGIATIMIGGETFEGTQLRKLLSLRSTAFTVTTEEDTVSFHTRGYGHRVGMSQYGANAMALDGCSYDEILLHYYQGAELTMYAD